MSFYHYFVRPLLVVAMPAICLAQDIKPAAPQVADATDDIPSVQTSYIVIPVEIRIQPLVTELEQNIPWNIKGSDQWTCDGDDCVKYEVYRSPLNVWAEHNNLGVIAQLSYWVQYSRRLANMYPVIAQCGLNEERPMLNIGLWTTIDWNANWHLDSRTMLVPVKSVRDCKMTVFNYNATPKIISKFTSILNERIADIDKQVPTLTDIRGKAEMLWKQLQTPTAVKNDVWLSVNPESIYVSPLDGNQQTLTFAICMKCHPKMIIQHDAPPTGTQPLPALKVLPPDNSDFHIELDSDIPLAEANRIANDSLRGTEFPVAGGKVKLKGLEISGKGHTLIVKADVEGKIKGALYFTATPYYDPVTQKIEVKDFDYSLETKNVLIKGASWLLHHKIKDKIHKQMSFSIASQLDAAKADLMKAINTDLAPQAKLTGNINQLSPLGIYCTAKAIKVVVVAEGGLKVIVK